MHIFGNTTAAAASNCNLILTAMVAATDVEATHNRVMFGPYLVNKASTGIHVADNGPQEAGASITGRPGCSFAGCGTGEPVPAFPLRRLALNRRRHGTRTGAGTSND